MTQKELVARTYKSFNKRNIPEAISTLQPDVQWAHGSECGYIYGHEEVATYWTRQWKLVDPRIEPLRFTLLDNGQLEVKVRQIVKDLKGFLLFDGIALHIYTFREGLIAKMEIGSTG